jgi:phosphatidylinositol 4-kinase
MSTSLVDSADLGASVAENFGKAISPGERQLSMQVICYWSIIANVPSASLASLASFKLDHAKTHVSQLAAKAYFLGEATGARMADSKGQYD